MLKKLVVGAALACASLTVVAPAASAISVVFAGVHPSHTAASKACSDGASQGRWWGCSFVGRQDGQTELWVQVG